MSSMCGDINDGLICNDDAGHKGDHSWNRDFEVTTWAKRPHAEAANAECPNCNGALSIGVYCGKCNPPTNSPNAELDSHGQTVRPIDTHKMRLNSDGDPYCSYCGEAEMECMSESCADNPHIPPAQVAMTREESPTIVQDFREYTAEEILHGIVKFTEQAGWGDPANLGHWLGAAQRWEKERV